MSNEIWKEIIPNILWAHTKCDVHLRNENGRMYFYDKSKMDVMFPINDLLDSPAIKLIPLLASLESKDIELRTDINFLFANQSAQFVDIAASVDFSKFDLVTHSGQRANNRGIANTYKAIGFISENKLSGEVARAQLTGAIENQDWNWTSGQDLFLASNVLSNTPTVLNSLFIQKVGQAISPTKILIKISEPILL